MIRRCKMGLAMFGMNIRKKSGLPKKVVFVQKLLLGQKAKIKQHKHALHKQLIREEGYLMQTETGISAGYKPQPAVRSSCADDVSQLLSFWGFGGVGL